MKIELDEALRTIDRVDASATEDRFVAGVEWLDNDCWLWHRSFAPAKESNGYTRIPLLWYGKGRKHGKMVFAHRYAYESRIGELPNQRYYALERDCSTELCVNPWHYTLHRREVFARRSHPNLEAKAKAKPMCRKGLHERTPENTFSYRGKQTCLPCRVATAKRASAKHYAKTKAKAN